MFTFNSKEDMVYDYDLMSDPILNRAIQRIADMNMSIDSHRCDTCGKIGRGIANPREFSFTCRVCILKSEIDRLHSDPEVEKEYKVWKLRRAKRDHELQKIVVVSIEKGEPDLSTFASSSDL